LAKIEEVRVPDIGDVETVDVSEVLVSHGDMVAEGDSLITLESDKASMEVPAPFPGVVQEIMIAIGDQVGEGTVIAKVKVGDRQADGAPDPVQKEEETAHVPRGRSEQGEETEPIPSAVAAPPKSLPQASGPVPKAGTLAHASPSVRRFARELGVDLNQVAGSGRKGRITQEDVKTHVKQRLSQDAKGPAAHSGSFLPEMPVVDFARYGEIEVKPLNRIRKLSATALHRSWLHVPHVTQHDEADITEMDAFRKAEKETAARKGVRLTPLAFMMKAVVAALVEFPEFNASLDPSGENLVLKKYFHLGVAVETPGGLVVPVFRDVDKKGVHTLAKELAEVSGRARDGKLRPADLGGACFTISSLGGIGGTYFTPIVNAPEVAILGVSRSSMKPIWDGAEFVPRLMLPLSLSYDHRVIDGAAAARFTTYLSGVLGDIRRLLL